MKKPDLLSTLLTAACLTVQLSLVSCASKGTSSAAAGAGSTTRSDYPFDANGNYRPEFLAANGGGNVVDLTKDNPASEFKSTATDDGWVAGSSSKPSSSGGSSSSSSKPKPTASSSSKPTSKPASKPTVAAAKPKAAPSKPAAPAPKIVMHTVAKKDTLFSLSRTYGTTVAAIQAANGLGSSTNLREGKAIKIPK
jgi:LysM repeat protein